MNRVAAIAVTIVLTVVAGWAGWAVATNDVPDALPVGDRVQAAVEGLRDSHVYVAPDSADLLTGNDLARIEAAAAAARPETFVIVWEATSESGFYLETEGLRQIGAELGRPGYYVGIGRGGVSSDDVGIDGDHVYARDFATDEQVTQPAVAAKLAEVIADSDGREYSEASTTQSAYWGGPLGAVAAGVFVGAVAGAVLTAVVVAVWFVARSRIRSRS